MTDTVILSVELPGFPPLPNVARRASHWSERADEFRTWRTSAFYAATQAMREVEYPADFPLRSAVVELVVIWPDERAPDPDNCVAAMKPVLDGITDAKVWTSDSFRVIGRLSVRREKGPKGLRVDVVSGSVA